jgi:hypothetical protein
MLIISKFKDYYDGVVGTTGIDKTIVYNRESKEFNPKDKDYPKFLFNSYSLRKKLDINPIIDLTPYSSPFLKKDIVYKTYQYFVIGFCGKQYIGFKLFYRDYIDNNEIKYDIIYGYDNIANYLDMTKKSYHNNNNFEERYNKIINFDYIDIFREFNIPIFVYEDSVGFSIFNKPIKKTHINFKFIINPILKDYEFYKVFDTYQTFQEISMFLGGVLGNNGKDIVEVDNKTKILKYGFDLKTSFRKDKMENK